MGNFWWTFLVFSLGPIFTVCVPLQDQNQTKADPAPLEFPKYSQNYTFVDNSSIRENLTNHQHGLIETEVEDLMEIPKDVEIPNTVKPQLIEETLEKKSEIEWIENGDDTEDSKFNKTEDLSITEKIITQASVSTTAGVEKVTSTTLKISTIAPATLPLLLESFNAKENTENEKSITEKNNVSESSFYENGVPLMNGTVAAVLAVSFLVLCVFGYAALIIWRKALEAKYGSREMLVDDDEIFDPDDMKHFSI